MEQLLKDINKVTILDVRDEVVFSKGHIKGAINFPINLTYEHKSINGKIIQPDKMQDILRQKGLDVSNNIVVYDNGSFFDASRLFWTLEVYGFKNVKLLNGGYDEWSTFEFPISKKAITPTPSNYIASINNKRLATKFTTQIATKNPKQTIIDARPYKAYVGKVSSAKRYGHIPKAIHIAAHDNIETKRLKTKEELQKLYNGINKNEKVIIYCAIGRIASTNYFALRELGYEVANYDASWKEWGNDYNLPVINKNK
jgi:thiosulfate/3-mercaptopyruvate sulfurtransferase